MTPQKSLSILDFGASGDGVSDNTKAFTDTVEQCSKDNGGKIIVPAGKFLTGPIHLKSNINLHLKKNACIVFNDNFANWPAIKSRWEGVECFGYSPCVYGENLTDVSITGAGTIDGRGQGWWKEFKRRKAIGQKQPESARDKEFAKLNENIDLSDCGGGGIGSFFFRPQLIQFNNCSNVLLNGFTTRNSPFWNTHLLYCKNVVVKNVTFQNPQDGINGDGLALDSAMLEKVRRTVQRNKINLMAMLTMRGDPQFVAARQVYDSGAIGEAVLVNARKSYKWGTRPDWFADKDKYGGTIGWVGIHAFDYINYITRLDFTKVAAMQSNFAHSERPGCEDNCALAVELANGGHATISVDYCRPETAGTHGDDWIRIVGTKGLLEASGSKKDCSVIGNDKGSFQQALPEGKDKIFSRFILNILGGKSNDEIAKVSFMLTKVCLIAREAAQKNKVLNIGKNND